ncbi:MAG: sugar transferase [Patescibacteria group bacterium]|nr:sugar transferase [Patescibacteria group bacterium]
MSLLNRKEPVVLLLGDLGSFVLALWLSLLIRSLEVPSKDLFLTHLLPFSLLFVLWILVFYIAGLYEKHTAILKSKLPSILANTQIANSTLAVFFFYFIPFFGITPKTILFIYLLVSFVIILSWRIYGYFVIGHSRPTNAILFGSGDEMKELLEEVNSNSIYNIKFIFSVDLGRADEKGFWDEIISRIYSDDVSVIAIDLANKNVEPVLPHLYNLIFSKISFIDMYKIYEDIFKKVPLSLLKYDWFLENISTQQRSTYDTLKRIMDIVVSLPLTLISLIFYPFVWVAIKLDDGGPLFISQERVGKRGRIIHLLKFRSMERNDMDLGGITHGENKVTRVGKILRDTRIDELPQLWGVLKGDLSLIGPRPELPSGVAHYTDEISYYNVRHLIKPGLSGWAQIYHDKHPHHSLDSLETANKLSYDLYYIKNRSFFLDIKIALRTLKTLASIAGR